MNTKEFRSVSASRPPRMSRRGLTGSEMKFLNVITGCPLSSLWRPRTIDFPLRFNLSQILDHMGEISGFGIGKSCFSQVDPLWMSSEHSWGQEITRMAPGKCQKPSGIMGVDGIHIIPKSQIWFFLQQKKTDLYISFTSPLSGPKPGLKTPHT